MTELLILIFAALLLIGSISIAMPSKASREISKLRMSAKLLGCNITSTLYGKNTFKNKVKLRFIYKSLSKPMILTPLDSSLPFVAH